MFLPAGDRGANSDNADKLYQSALSEFAPLLAVCALAFQPGHMIYNKVLDKLGF